MAKITNQANVLLTHDVAKARDYWRDRLGFAVSSEYGDPVEFVIMKRDGAFVMLGKAQGHADLVPFWKQRPNLWNAYFWVDDATAMFAEMQARGATIDYDLCDQPYGVREFGVRDTEDNDIGFGQVLAPPTAN